MLINFIQEHIVLPLSDLITGNSVHKHLKFLLESQHWNKQQIADFQNERLQILIKHAYEHVPFYRDTMHALGLTPEDIRTKDDLVKLPIVDKALMRKEGMARFTADNIPSREIIRLSSSGSTGQPFPFLLTKDSYSMNLAASLRGWYSMGWRLGDKYIKMSQNPRNQLVKRVQDCISRNKYIAINPLTEEHFAVILQQIEDYRPEVIRCYPDPLLFLAQYKLKHPEYKYSPKAITTTGNTLHKETREIIEQAFGCKIFDAYGNEAAACTFELPLHNGYWCADEFGISEVVDENGNSITKGTGRMVSTNLWNMAHPFIRYDTQDLVELMDEPCEETEHTTLKRILGRDNEVLIMPNGRHYIVHHFTIFFEGIYTPELKGSIDQFQVVGKSDDSVLFKLIVNDQYDDSVKDFIISYWEKEFGVPVNVQTIDSLPLMHNNKRRFIVNE